MKNFVVGMFLFAVQALQPSVSEGNNELNSQLETIIYTENFSVENNFQSISVGEIQGSATEYAEKQILDITY